MPESSVRKNCGKIREVVPFQRVEIETVHIGKLNDEGNDNGKAAENQIADKRDQQNNQRTRVQIDIGARFQIIVGKRHARLIGHNARLR